jgi:uncharacterized protein (DUF4213/DUF364 family)
MSAILERVHAAVADRAAAATGARVTVGDRLVGVSVGDPDDGRLVGLAHRPADEPAVELAGHSASDLAAGATGDVSRFERAVGVATLNALSAPEMAWRSGDPMAALPADVGVIATVGLFGPAFRKFDRVTVRVVERDPPAAASVDAPAGVDVETYAPDACETAFDGADVCFVTGSTLVYGGVQRYLDALSAAGVAPVVLVGATASHLPGAAFDAGVDVVAGARVTAPDRALSGVAAGDCGTDLHDAGVEKVYVARGSSGLELGDPEREAIATNGSDTHTANERG